MAAGGIPTHREGFGARVRQLRQAQQLSQEQVAERSGLHRNYIGGIERGERNVSLDSIIKLAHGLGVHPADLFGPQPTS